MATSLSGIASYQQTSQIWKKDQNIAAKEKEGESVKNSSSTNTTISEWKPVSKNSPLVPTTKAGYGTVVGDVELSDKAREYYDKLKSKFHGMDFILVSKDMKSQVAANASAFGNAYKPVVLIDDEKLEKMANDEAFRIAGARFNQVKYIHIIFGCIVDTIIDFLDANASESEDVSVTLNGVFTASVAIENGIKVMSIVPGEIIKQIIKEDSIL